MASINTVDAYIAQFNEPTREILQRVREAIHAGAPNTTEKISYGMPAFGRGENLVYFAAAKKHIGLYPTASGVAAFAGRLTGYSVSKGTIRFPLDKPIPYGLITEIAAFRAREAEEH